MEQSIFSSSITRLGRWRQKCFKSRASISWLGSQLKLVFNSVSKGNSHPTNFLHLFLPASPNAASHWRGFRKRNGKTWNRRLRDLFLRRNLKCFRQRMQMRYLYFCYKHALYKHAWAEIFHILSTLLSTLSASDLFVTQFSGKIFLAHSADLSLIFHIFVCTSVIFLVLPI